MKFTPFRKYLVKSIIDGKIKNIDDLIHTKFESFDLPKDYPTNSTIDNRDKYQKTLHDFYLLTTFFNEFISLVTELETEKQIYFSRETKENDFFPYCFYNSEKDLYFAADREFEKLYNQWHGKTIKIHDYKELVRFLKYKFMEEKEYHELKLAKSQKVLVWVAILISILSLIATTTINLLNSSKTQSVKVVEPIEIAE